MSLSRSLALLAILSGAYAQSSSAAITATTTSGAAGSSAAVSQALTATTPVSVSINPSLPQSAGTGPMGFTIPSLSALTSGAMTDGTVALDSTYPAAAQPTKVSGAPALPNIATLNPANYPALDVSPPTNSTQVQAWLRQVDFSKVPTYNVTDGTCAGTPGAITDGRCWWTCGGCTRRTDITVCPDKFTWGLSYDDGPSPYTPLLLDYLNAQNVTSTFFLVGSRVISRPAMVQSEYMSGHQLSVHTWSHPYLTKLSNEQIVAELGWTKQVIKDVTGVTPNTFRPPYGDIDDRVRAIAAQMGLTPIIWSSITTNGTTTNFDTTDWNIPGGTATGESSLTKFEQILNTYVPQLNTGFIVLEHDLYQQTVDLAVGYVLPMAIAAGKFKLKSIISCLGLPLSEAYIETSSNTTNTRITTASGGSTYFQASLGTGTGAAVSATGVSSGGGVAASGGSASGSAAASSTSRSAAAPAQINPINHLPSLMTLLALKVGMALVA